MCGVFGIRSPQRDVARITYFGLFALQHRGQESAGIAVSDDGRLTVLRDMGLVSQVFDEQKLSGLHGDAAIGHTRYSTTGSTQWANAQPLLHHGRARTVALGHNGNLTNAPALRDATRRGGRQAVVHVRQRADRGADRERRRARSRTPSPDAMRRLEGAYSIVALSEGTLIAFRDPFGFRPLVLGRLDGEWVVASESCALDLVGADFEREVAPRRARPDRRATAFARCRRSSRPSTARSASSSSSTSPGPTRGSRASRCTRARVRMGERLAAEAPVDADLVLPIPDSGTPAAIGFSRASGIPFSEGLIKNRYVGRTFIQPEQGLREQGVEAEVQPARRGRGQARRRRRRLDRPRQHDAPDRADALRRRRDRGARARLAPPVIGQCFYGIDLADPDEMIASNQTVEEIREHIGATSLAYLSLEGLRSRRAGRHRSSAARASRATTRPTFPADADEAQVRAGRVVRRPSALGGPPADAGRQSVCRDVTARWSASRYPLGTSRQCQSWSDRSVGVRRASGAAGAMPRRSAMRSSRSHEISQRTRSRSRRPPRWR